MCVFILGWTAQRWKAALPELRGVSWCPAGLLQPALLCQAPGQGLVPRAGAWCEMHRGGPAGGLHPAQLLRGPWGVVGELKGLISFTLCFLQVHYNRCSTVSCTWPSHQTVIWSQICVGDIRLHITKPEKVTAQNHLSLEILLSCLHQPVIPFSTNKRQKPLHIV